MAFPGGLLAVSLALLFATEGQPPPAPDWIPRLLAAEEAAEGFYPLYNGSDLDGWTVTGPNKDAFSAQGEVLAITGEGGGEWLVSTESYEQFVLRYGFRMITEAGPTGAPPEQTGNGSKKGDIPRTTRAEKRGRGASQRVVQMLSAATLGDRPLGEWNEAEVVCSEGRVRTTVNGVEGGDAPARPGYIGIWDCGQRIEFRGIRIKPLPGGSGWSQWDGKAGDALPESFELRFRFKPSPDSRGGVVFASKKSRPLFEVRIDNHAAEAFTGSIAGKAGALELRALDGCWNPMWIAVDGPNMRVWVNGKTVVDFVSTRRASCAGAGIRFNVDHGSIEFEDIEIKAKE
ncbi:MAG TPA: family 16 glycoside hydrolase [Candidatus Bathyarchaeia archaeon]|nr:family 16 glycoside hydrolase [Candidatus Bathyarchaeia archaeon]